MQQATHPENTGSQEAGKKNFRVLVTGGTGFLGAYILKHLIEKNFSVRALRRSARDPFFIDPAILERIEWVEGDVLDTVSLYDAMEGMDVVIHAAAVVSFTSEDRKRMYQVNVEGTANVVNAAIDSGVKRMVHISSVAALGRTTEARMVDEEKKWEENSSNTHYAISKHAAEMHVWRGFAEGLGGVVLNPSTILGYGDWHQSSCALFRNGYREFAWYSRGWNGFVGVEDVAEAAVRFVCSDINHKKFIVSAENRDFRELFTAIAHCFGKRPPQREATPFLGKIAWRLEALRAGISGNKPLLTRETSRIALSKTSFDNRRILAALPGFSFTPLEEVIRAACEKYVNALREGAITL
jgi:nucleoside-diphosphate-sugar epimerase